MTADWLATGADEAGDDPLFDAELAARFGDSERAIAAYEAIIASGSPPKLVARARIGLGLLAFEGGEHDEAIEKLEEGLAGLSPGRIQQWPQTVSAARTR